MPILAIDTATKAAGAAIIAEGTILAEFHFHLGKTHSQRFLPMVESLLYGAELALADMEAVAVTVGPGSFTGLRIGLATAKAWGQALQKPLLPVVTLDALAQNADAHRYAVPMLDARKNEVYCSLYADGERQWDYLAKEPAALAAELRQLAGEIEFLGDGAAAYFPLMREALGERAILAPEPRRLFMAVAVAKLAEKAWQQGRYMDYLQIEPFYLRLSEAENRLLAQKKEAARCD